MPPRPLSPVAILLCLLSCGGSSPYRLDGDIERRPLSADESRRHQGLVASGDEHWVRRSEATELDRAIALWHEAVRIKDDDWQTYARLAQAYFFRADAHLSFAAMGGDYPFDGDDAVDKAAAERYRASHRKGFALALRGMAARSPEFEQRLRGGIDLEVAVRVIRADAAALLYWYVANLASYARAEGLGALFQNRNRISECVFHLARIAPEYHFRGPDRLLGVYFAAAPAMVGGDLGKSRRHFEAAISAAPEFLMTRVFAAEFLDRRSHDRASFKRRLDEVLKAAEGSDAALPENKVARWKAERLLLRIDRYFPSGS